jgi:hypothetical protein
LPLSLIIIIITITIIIISPFDPLSSSEGTALSPLLFNYALEYVIKKIEGNQMGLKSNGTHQLLAYADDVNLLGDNIGTI